MGFLANSWDKTKKKIDARAKAQETKKQKALERTNASRLNAIKNNHRQKTNKTLELNVLP